MRVRTYTIIFLLTFSLLEYITFEDQYTVWLPIAVTIATKRPLAKLVAHHQAKTPRPPTTALPVQLQVCVSRSQSTLYMILVLHLARLV